MSYIADDGLLRLEVGDLVTPLETNINAVTESVGERLASWKGIVEVADDTERDSYAWGLEPSKSNPLFVFNKAAESLQSNYGHGWFAGLEYDTGYLEWVMLPGYAARAGSGYPNWVRQVGSVVYGELHVDWTQGSWASNGTTAFAKLPRASMHPASEVRWLGFRTNYSESPLGGWIASGTGEVTLQYPSRNPTPIGSHFSVLVHPWVATGL